MCAEDRGRVQGATPFNRLSKARLLVGKPLNGAVLPRAGNRTLLRQRREYGRDHRRDRQEVRAIVLHHRGRPRDDLRLVVDECAVEPRDLPAALSRKSEEPDYVAVRGVITGAVDGDQLCIR